MNRVRGFFFTVVILSGVYAGIAYYSGVNGLLLPLPERVAGSVALLVALPLVVSGAVKWWDIWVAPAPKLGAPWNMMTPNDFVGSTCKWHGFILVGAAILVYLAQDVREIVSEDLPEQKRQAVAALLSERDSLTAEIEDMDRAMDRALEPPELPTPSYAPANPFLPIGQAEDPSVAFQRREQLEKARWMLNEKQNKLKDRLSAVNSSLEADKNAFSKVVAVWTREKLVADRARTEESLKTAIDRERNSPKYDTIYSIKSSEQKREEYRSSSSYFKNRLIDIDKDIRKHDASVVDWQNGLGLHLQIYLSAVVFFVSLSVPRRTGYSSGQPISTGAGVDK